MNVHVTLIALHYNDRRIINDFVGRQTLNVVLFYVPVHAPGEHKNTCNAKVSHQNVTSYGKTKQLHTEITSVKYTTFR